MTFDPQSLGLTELLRLQDELARHMRQRFGRMMACCFTDVVDSVDYFRRFGDAAGRAMQQRHFDLVQAVATKYGGRIVDTAGDGAFFVFPSAANALRALCELQTQATLQNQQQSSEHHLVLRAGLHWGFVLTDDRSVAGDTVNLCSRVTSIPKERGRRTADITITHAAFLELPTELRVRCHPLPPATLKGIAAPIEVFSVEWEQKTSLPERVRAIETGAVWELPHRDVIGFGRLKEHGGRSANDVVLASTDETSTAKIGRWHFELRRTSTSFVLRALSENSPTEIDGKLLASGQEAELKTGSIVKVGRVLTLVFESSAPKSAEQTSATVTDFDHLMKELRRG